MMATVKCCVVMLALFAACASAGPHLVSATQSSVALVQDFGFAVGGMAHVNVSSYDRLTLAVGLCRSITEVASWNILRCFEYVRLDVPISVADHYYVVVSPCDIKGDAFPQFTFYASLELVNPGGEYLSAGEIPLKVTTIIETLLWVLIYGAFMGYHVLLRRKTDTFNRLVYFVSAWPASQFCMAAVTAVKVWHMHYTGQPSNAVTIFVGISTALSLVTSAAVLFLLAAGFCIVSAEPWKSQQWWLMGVMVAIIAAAVSSGLLLSRSVAGMAAFGGVALLLAASFVFVLVALFVLIRRTRRTIESCSAHPERRTDISVRFQRLAIASAFTLAGAVIYLVALASLAFWSNTIIATWISDTYFSLLFMLYCVATLVFFRLNVNEDLNLVPLLPAAPEFHSPMGVLPEAPAGFIDDEGDDAF